MVTFTTERVLTAWLAIALLSISPTGETAIAQVQDDDLEFEDHVATIELDESSPVLEGVGSSRQIGYEAQFEGTLFLSVMAEQGIDPLLRLEDADGGIIAQDDDSGGGKHA